jgi:hypothetical protein
VLGRLAIAVIGGASSRTRLALEALGGAAGARWYLYRLMRTALSHLVFALAQMVQAIARRCDILAYGLCGFENWAPWEVGAEVVGVDSIVFI